MNRTGAEIRYEILELCRSKDGNIDYEKYPAAETLVLADVSEEEEKAYGIYMARITGVV